MQQATYSLDEVFRLIGAGKIAFSAPSRSTWQVITAYAGTATPKDEEGARGFICEGLKQLKPENFCGSQMQWGDLVVDKYGLIFDGRPWFTKFAVTEGELEEISFHPPEKELKTLGGLVIPKG